MVARPTENSFAYDPGARTARPATVTPVIFGTAIGASPAANVATGCRFTRYQLTTFGLTIRTSCRDGIQNAVSSGSVARQRQWKT